MMPDPLLAEDEPTLVLESFAEVFGFVFKELGASGLRDVVALSGVYREDLEKAAIALALVGLTKAGAIVAEHVPNARPASEAPRNETEFRAELEANRQRQEEFLTRKSNA
jgi:hypothetical protein